MRVLGVIYVAAEPRLTFIRSQEQVCTIRGHEIHKITSVIAVPLESECELEVESCSVTPPKVENAQAHTSPGGTTTVPPVVSPGPHVASEGGIPVISWNRVKIPPCPNSRKYGG